MKKIEKIGLESILEYLDNNHFTWIKISRFLEIKEETKKHLLYLKKFCEKRIQNFENSIIAQNLINSDSLKILAIDKLLKQLVQIEDEFKIIEEILDKKKFENNNYLDVKNKHFILDQDYENIIFVLVSEKEIIKAMIEDFENLS